MSPADQRRDVRAEVGDLSDETAYDLTEIGSAEVIAFRLSLVASAALAIGFGIAAATTRATSVSHEKQDHLILAAVGAPVLALAAFYAIRWAITGRLRPLLPLR